MFEGRFKVGFLVFFWAFSAQGHEFTTVNFWRHSKCDLDLARVTSVNLRFKTQRDYLKWTLANGLSPFSILFNIKLSPSMISQIQNRILEGSKDLHRTQLSELTSLFEVILQIFRRIEISPEQLSRIVSTDEFPNISPSLIQFVTTMDSVWIKELGLISGPEFYLRLESQGLSDYQITKVLSETIKRTLSLDHLRRVRAYLDSQFVSF